jgi:hypothetical protein
MYCSFELVNPASPLRGTWSYARQDPLGGER